MYQPSSSVVVSENKTKCSKTGKPSELRPGPG